MLHPAWSSEWIETTLKKHRTTSVLLNILHEYYTAKELNKREEMKDTEPVETFLSRVCLDKFS